MACAPSPALTDSTKPAVTAPPPCSSLTGNVSYIERKHCLVAVRGLQDTWIRRSSTDLRVHQHATHEYGTFLHAIPDIQGIRTVLDAGANGGYSTAIFAQQLPRVVNVLAVEPDAGNHAMLVLNTKRYPAVTPVRAAVWGRDEPMRVGDGSRKIRTSNRQWAFVTVPRHSNGGPGTPTSSVDGLSIATILQSACLPAFDLVKLDTEGSEWRTLRGPTAWLKDTRYIYLEAHDDADANHNSERAGLLVLHQRGFSVLAVFPSGFRYDRVYLGCNTRFLSPAACEGLCVTWKNDTHRRICRAFNHTAARRGKSKFIAAGPKLPPLHRPRAAKALGSARR